MISTAPITSVKADLYSALKELQKEEADTRSQLAEFSLGKKVKAEPKRKWVELKSRMKFITMQHQRYVQDHQEMEYLSEIAANIAL